MGSACCVAARDKTIQSASSNEFFHRNMRYSPTWSFRWENRGRVAGEEASVSWLSDGINRHNGSEIKCEAAYASEDGSSLDSYSFQRRTWPKSPFSEGAPAHVRTPPSDQSISRNASMNANIEQVEPKESPAISSPTPPKLSFSSLPSTSSVVMSPSSFHVPIQPSSSTPSTCPDHDPKRRLHQASESGIPGLGSTSSQLTAKEKPSWSNGSTRGSYGGSSDGCSVNAFSELMAASHAGNGSWSFDSEPFGFSREKVSKSSKRVSISADRQTCGICLKLLTEKSSWSSQKIIANNELSVVAVLICGHVYHADCLESMTPEIDKYDPACPVCTFGEKQTFKMSEKALKAELESRLKKAKKSKHHVVDMDLSGDYAAVLDRRKGSGHEDKGCRLLASSSSMKSSSSSSKPPFLRRHFSFGSKVNRPLSENTSTTRKKGFFWSKSSKE